MDELPPEVVRHLRDGRWIQAIKALREHLDVDLASAKNIIDGYRHGDGPPDLPSAPPPSSGYQTRQQHHALPARVVGLLHSGQKIEAIKRLREERGLGLKDAHDQVQAYLGRHPELARLNPSGGGRFLVIAAVVIVVVAYVAWRTV
ncbi:MAG: hypothetical protein AAGE01_14290 [Pseudomonadota bacterium]